MTSHNPHVVPLQSANQAVPVTSNMLQSGGISFSVTPQNVSHSGGSLFSVNQQSNSQPVSGGNAQMGGGLANWGTKTMKAMWGDGSEHSSPVGTPPMSVLKSSGQFYPGGTPPMSKSSDKFAPMGTGGQAKWGHTSASVSPSDSKFSGGQKKNTDDISIDSGDDDFEDIPPLAQSENDFVGVNGITHDLFKDLQLDKDPSIKQCQFCQKYYRMQMTTTDYDPQGDSVCFHCIFTMVYNPPECRINFDGSFGKTIIEYITECKDYHDKENCTHSSECFICDHLNGKFIENIMGAEELFGSNENNFKQEQPIDYCMDISI
jgi:hypothetical protein